MIRLKGSPAGRVGILILLTAAILLGPITAMGAAPMSTRPISDFISAQGTTNGFIPPIPDFIGWGDNPFHQFASVDYTGLAAAWLRASGGPDVGTTVSGTVTERKLSDGRVMVTVVLRTTRAITWVWGGEGDLATGPLQFGYRANEILADPTVTPALSNSEMKAQFTNTGPGAPLPDLVAAFILGGALPGQELRSLMFRSSGTGAIHEIFGVPEGTPGQLIVTQTGIFMPHSQAPTYDGFPAERVDLHPLE
ncbi:MAG TPA: hypothetical protein VFS09_09495 [Candidatus Eisenbacteria bacterium]|nr:hypothetical protein [Candidatus Eisenbacteria bacterium]